MLPGGELVDPDEDQDWLNYQHPPAHADLTPGAKIRHRISSPVYSDDVTKSDETTSSVGVQPWTSSLSKKFGESDEDILTVGSPTRTSGRRFS